MRQFSKEEVDEVLIEFHNEYDKTTIGNYKEYIKGKDDYPSFSQIINYYNDSWAKATKEVLNKVDQRKVNYKIDSLVDKIKEANKKTGEKTYTSIVSYCKKNNIDFPSINYIREHFVSWNYLKGQAFPNEKNVPDFCIGCGVGRCRFNHDLDKCEYYRG